MRRIEFLTIFIMIALTGCSSQEPPTPTADIGVRVRTCIDNGSRCFALPLPGADIKLEDQGGVVLAVGKTDDTGHCKLPLVRNSRVRVVVTSPLIEGGTAVGDVGPITEGVATLSIDHAIAKNSSS